MAKVDQNVTQDDTEANNCYGVDEKGDSVPENADALVGKHDSDADRIDTVEGEDDLEADKVDHAEIRDDFEVNDSGNDAAKSQSQPSFLEFQHDRLASEELHHPR
ncbi:MAG: hypothetical protein PHE55_18295 [Methylococcaceae bacterium]|nr:hypothetical protein [Methylococcaceae bacterium]